MAISGHCWPILWSVFTNRFCNNVYYLILHASLPAKNNKEYIEQLSTEQQRHQSHKNNMIKNAIH